MPVLNRETGGFPVGRVSDLPLYSPATKEPAPPYLQAQAATLLRGIEGRKSKDSHVQRVRGDRMDERVDRHRRPQRTSVGGQDPRSPQETAPFSAVQAGK